MVKAVILLLYSDSIQINKFSHILISRTVDLSFTFTPDKKSDFTNKNIAIIYKETRTVDARKSLIIMEVFIHISYQFPTLAKGKANYFILVTLMSRPLLEEYLTLPQFNRLLSYGWKLK